MALKPRRLTFWTSATFGFALEGLVPVEGAHAAGQGAMQLYGAVQLLQAQSLIFSRIVRQDDTWRTGRASMPDTPADHLNRVEGTEKGPPPLFSQARHATTVQL